MEPRFKKTRFVHHQGNQSKSRKKTLKVHNSEPKKKVKKKGSILFRRDLKNMVTIWLSPNLGMTWE
jgi:hypothetical protein